MMNKRLLFTSPAMRRQQQGFSMLEVLISLLIIAFGLLGVAGMQAVSVGNTSTAGYRSVAALQASSIAGAMSANSVYWQATGAPATVSVAKGVVTSSDSALTGTVPDCTIAGNCVAPASLAMYDLSLWGVSLDKTLPGGTGSIACTAAVTSVFPNTPAVCSITINWVEKTLSQNQAAATSTNVASTFDFQMMVVP